MTMASREVQDRAGHLSALVDGELDPNSVAGVCAEWRDDAGVRERWHRYQLIGDVLRSEDLANTAAHDSAFLVSLRSRLELEPVVLAPSPASTVTAGDQRLSVASRRSRIGWRAAAAVAAGFVVVAAGTAVLSPSSSTVELARAPAGSVLPVKAVASDASSLSATAPQRDAMAAGEPQAMTANGSLIRDARLDRYLAAHQQWSGGSVIGGHAAFLRHVAADAPKR